MPLVRDRRTKPDRPLRVSGPLASGLTLYVPLWHGGRAFDAVSGNPGKMLTDTGVPVVRKRGRGWRILNAEDPRFEFPHLTRQSQNRASQAQWTVVAHVHVGSWATTGGQGNLLRHRVSGVGGGGFELIEFGGFGDFVGVRVTRDSGVNRDVGVTRATIGTGEMLVVASHAFNTTRFGRYNANGWTQLDSTSFVVSSPPATPYACLLNGTTNTDLVVYGLYVWVRELSTHNELSQLWDDPWSMLRPHRYQTTRRFEALTGTDRQQLLRFSRRIEIAAPAVAGGPQPGSYTLLGVGR